MPGSERPHTDALDRTATGVNSDMIRKFNLLVCHVIEVPVHSMGWHSNASRMRQIHVVLTNRYQTDLMWSCFGYCNEISLINTLTTQPTSRSRTPIEKKPINISWAFGELRLILFDRNDTILWIHRTLIKSIYNLAVKRRIINFK
jgi:hypothetical protein